MINIKGFSVIGGDKRQLCMAQSIANDGYNVYVAGFDKITDNYPGLEYKNLDTVTLDSDYVILPVPVTKDLITLNAPFSDNTISLNNNFIDILKNKIIFGGLTDYLYKISDDFKKLNILDFSKREEFSVRNAVPTAEGAIEIAMREYKGTINSSKCLIAGYGRIGKILSWMLKGLGANVYVSARKTQDLSWIESMGYHAVHTQKIDLTNGYDIIFNTIPKLIFDSHTLAKTAQNSLVIDLASAPGGVDFKAANRLGIKSIQALSLPGKVAPITAGEIIKTTIYNMIEEEFS